MNGVPIKRQDIDPEEDSDEDMESAPQLRGRFTCNYCGLPYAQQRFVIRYPDEDPVWFCQPECMAGWDWLIMGTEVRTEEQMNSRREHYRKSFGREVVPTPQWVFHTPDTDRMEWLRECRRVLSKDDQVQAEADLQVMSKRDLHRATRRGPILPDDMAPRYATIEDPLPIEIDAQQMPEDDFFDMGDLMDQMQGLNMGILTTDESATSGVK